jgi:hypothetical protein
MTVGFEVFVQLVIAAMTDASVPQLELRTVQLDLDRGGLDLATATRAAPGAGACAPSPPRHLLGGRVAGRKGLRDRVVVVSVLDAKV